MATSSSAVESLVVGRGHPLPIGTSRMAEGVNFALISRHATAVSLILSEDDDGMAVEIPLDPRLFRTGTTGTSSGGRAAGRIHLRLSRRWAAGLR